MANRIIPQFPPLREQIRNNPRLGIEIPLGLLEHLSKPEMTQEPVTLDGNTDNFLGLYYQVDLKVLKNWAEEV